MRQQLAQNGYLGKPLGVPSVREKKYRGKRLYFIVHNKRILLLVFAPKRDQRKIVERILAERGKYFALMDRF